MSDHAKPRVAVGGDGVGAVVARSIIDDDKFEVRMALDQDAFDGLGKERTAVTDGHDDGDVGAHVAHTSAQISPQRTSWCTIRHPAVVISSRNDSSVYSVSWVASSRHSTPSSRFSGTCQSRSKSG